MFRGNVLENVARPSKATEGSFTVYACALCLSAGPDIAARRRIMLRMETLKTVIACGRDLVS